MPDELDERVRVSIVKDPDRVLLSVWNAAGGARFRDETTEILAQPELTWEQAIDLADELLSSALAVKRRVGPEAER